MKMINVNAIQKSSSKFNIVKECKSDTTVQVGYQRFQIEQTSNMALRSELESAQNDTYDKIVLAFEIVSIMVGLLMDTIDLSEEY